MALDKAALFKSAELIITIVLYALCFHYANYPKYTSIIIDGTMLGYIIICGVLLAGLLTNFGDNNENIAFTIVGAILFFVTGALYLWDWIDENEATGRGAPGLVTALLVIGNGVVFLFDFLFIK